MIIDLTRIFPSTAALKTQVRNGVIKVDEAAVARGIAVVVARRMSLNLMRGIMPDGSGPMPGRKKDGRPRGKSSKIAFGITPVRTGTGKFNIAAHREKQGHLYRILQEVPFRAPPMTSMQKEINAVVAKAVKYSTP